MSEPTRESANAMLDAIRELSERVAARPKPTTTLLHMLDLLDMSRIARREGWQMTRIRKGMWKIGCDELQVWELVERDKMLQFDTPSHSFTRPTLDIKQFDDEWVPMATSYPRYTWGR